MAEVDQNLGEHDAEAEEIIVNTEAVAEEPKEEEHVTFEEPIAEAKVGHVEEPIAGGGGEKKWPGWPGESVFRMLVPAQKVGGIIGRKGEFIKKIVEETRARIKILDGPPGTAERAVSVFNYSFFLMLLIRGCIYQLGFYNVLLCLNFRWLLMLVYFIN